jgi:hypothetical protein
MTQTGIREILRGLCPGHMWSDHRHHERVGIAIVESLNLHAHSVRTRVLFNFMYASLASVSFHYLSHTVSRYSNRRMDIVERV